MTREYEIALRFKVVVGSVLVLAVATLLTSYKYSSPDQSTWLLTTVGIVFLMGFALFFLLTSKVIVTPDYIMTENFLTTNEMHFHEIAAYRLRRIPKTRRYRIILVSKEGRKMRVPYSNLRNGEEILALVQSRFPNLDEG